MNDTIIIILAAILPIVILLTVILPLTVFKKAKKPEANIFEFEQILIALGNENIKTVNKTLDRIKLEIKDKDLIDVNALRSLKVMATIKGNELTILYRNDSEGLFNYLQSKI